MIGVVDGGLLVAAAAFAWGLGAHYTGACMGMPLAAGALTVPRALLLMAPLAFLGAVLAAGGVEATVGHGILLGAPTTTLIALVIVATALGLTTAFTYLALPTSTIQILVFAIVGAGVASGRAVAWTTIETLLAIWAVAPCAAVALGYAFVRCAAVAAPRKERAPAGAMVAGLVGVGAVASFAMGANDVVNATGPVLMSGLLGLGWAGLLGGLGLALGVLTWGGRLLRAVAFDVVRMDPGMAFGAQLGQATVILISVGFGYFTSMNQALVGAMVGGGLARGRRTVQWGAVRGILLGWAVGPLSALAVGWAVVRALGVPS
jgi:inorganic phosphate transporter, PiT family